MKERTKTFIDGLCVSFIAVFFFCFHTALSVLVGFGFLYVVFKCFMAADMERLWRRKHHDDGTHDYYGNKLEEDEK